MGDGSSAAAMERIALLRLVPVAVLGGVLSGLLGVGGGVIMVPLLVLWLGYDQRTAHALSLGAIIPIALGGIASYGIAGEIDVLAALALTAGAVVGARAGAIVLAGIEPDRLQVIFGLFLVLVAITMIVRS
jgi:hypothetical protein